MLYSSMALSFPREKHMGVRCLLRLQAVVRPFIRTIEECSSNVLLPWPVEKCSYKAHQQRGMHYFMIVEEAEPIGKEQDHSSKIGRGNHPKAAKKRAQTPQDTIVTCYRILLW